MRKDTKFYGWYWSKTNIIQTSKEKNLQKIYEKIKAEKAKKDNNWGIAVPRWIYKFLKENEQFTKAVYDDGPTRKGYYQYQGLHIWIDDRKHTIDEIEVY